MISEVLERSDILSEFGTVKTFCFRYMTYIEGWWPAMVTQLVGGGAGIQIAPKALSPNKCVSLSKVESRAIIWQKYSKGLEKNEHFLQLTGQVISYSQLH